MLPRENIRGASLNPLLYQECFSEWRPRERVLLSIRFEIISHSNPPDITLSAELLRANIRRMQALVQLSCSLIGTGKLSFTSPYNSYGGKFRNSLNDFLRERLQMAAKLP